MTLVPASIKKLRLDMGLNQTEFWDAVGVNQTSGSRYENGLSKIPQPVCELVRLLYIEKIDLNDVKGEDILVARFLREEAPDMFEVLKRAAQSKPESIGSPAEL